MNAIQKIEQLLTGAGKRVYLIRDAVFSAGWLVQNCEFPAVLLFERRPRNYVQKGVGPMRERIGCKMVCVTTTSYEFQTTENDAIQETQRTELLSCLTLLRRSHDFDDLTIGQSAVVYDGAVGVLLTGAAVDVEASLLAGECGVLPDAGMNITENGRHQVVGLTWVDVDVQGGGNIEPPTDEEQTITPTPGVDGFAPVVVGACPVCPTPHIQPLSVTPSTSNQTFTPSAPVDGYGPVDVAGVDSTIDHNIQPQNIKAGVDILGVTGAFHGTIAPLNVSPATTAQTVTPPAGTDGFSPVTVDAVTAAIDANIQPGNIKQGVEILGVVGTLNDDDFVKWWLSDFCSITNRDGRTMPPFNHDIVDSWGICTTLAYMVVNLDQDFEHDIILPYVTSVGQSPFRAKGGAKTIKGVVDLSGLTTLTHTNPGYGIFSQSIYGVQVYGLKLGVLTTFASNASLGGTNQNLMRFISVGAGTAVDLHFMYWRATDVIAEGPTAIAELNANIVAGLADRVADRTGDSSLTITFGTSLYNVLTAETLAAFTSKNWNVAYA